MSGPAGSPSWGRGRWVADPGDSVTFRLGDAVITYDEAEMMWEARVPGYDPRRFFSLDNAIRWANHYVEPPS